MFQPIKSLLIIDVVSIKFCLSISSGKWECMKNFTTMESKISLLLSESELKLKI